ncbi:MAG: GYF domain-containing protein, partial [bacterium]
MNSSYYLRWKGVTTGPLTPDQVREQFRTGKISRFHEVSPDQRDWRPLAELPELLPKPPPVVAAPTVVPTGKRTLTPLSGASRAELPNNTPDEPVPPPSRRAPAATAEAECPNG